MSFATVAAGSAGFRTIGVAIRGDATSLTSALARGTRDVRAFETQTTASAGRLSGAWKLGLAATTIAVLVLVKTLTGAGMAAAGFESRMRNVNTLIRESDAGLASISKSVLDLSTKLPTGANDLAEGLYQVASSGFAGAEGLTVLEASGRAASAGISSTENAVTAITAVLNAYGLSASSANDVSDVLFQTVNLGVVEFDQLTGVIGDVVGMAAAAKVPIQDVGAAIATMTLSGLSANESGTSLNRLLTQLIQPSEALAATYHQLGYESGAMALETKGLFGVMEDLRKATGGSVEAYLRLFPEIRGARGAFNLAADEGRTYARVQEQVANQSVTLGATQRALDEQLRAASNQWRVFTNTLTAGAIELGGQVLPAFTAVLDVLQDLAADAVPTLNQALAVTQPLWATLSAVGADIVGILGALMDAAVPVARTIGGIAAGATLAGLQVLATSLEAVTGFLAEHPALVVAVAALWASRYLPSITAVAGGLQRFTIAARTQSASALGMITDQIRYQQVLQRGAVFNGTATGQIGRFSAAMSAARTTTVGLGRAMVSSGLATAGLTIGIMAVVHAAQTGADEVKAAIADLTSGITDFSGPEVEQALAGLQDIRAEYEALAAWDDSWEPGRNTISAYVDYDALIATGNAIADLNEKAANTTVNLIAVAQATGMTVAELSKLQAAQGIDLTFASGTEQAKAGRDQLIAYLQDIERQTGTSAEAITSAVGGSLDEWEAFGKAIQAATDKAQQAAMSAMDVVGAWKPNIGIQEEADAVESLADAQEALAEARLRMQEAQAEEDPSDRSMRSAQETVIDAEKRVADAEARLTEAQTAKTEGTLEAFYARSIALGEAFSRDLNEAVQMGLDPAVMSKLLQQGPEQAGPILTQLVGDHSGRLIEMVNASEQAISEITGQIAEQARLTAMAVNSSTDELSRDLPNALSIQSLSWQGNTPEEIAAKLGLDAERVRQIAEAFGITIAEGIQAGFSSVPQLNDRGSDTNYYGGRFAQAPWKPSTGSGFGAGGIYPGYTPGRDIGMIGVSGGEAIMRPEWTRAVGPAAVNWWNYLARSGGEAAVRRAMTAYMGGFAGGGIAGAYQPAAQVVTVPVQSTHRYFSPIYAGQIVTPDVAGFASQARRMRARENRIGG